MRASREISPAPYRPMLPLEHQESGWMSSRGRQGSHRLRACSSQKKSSALPRGLRREGSQAPPLRLDNDAAPLEDDGRLLLLDPSPNAFDKRESAFPFR